MANEASSPVGPAGENVEKTFVSLYKKKEDMVKIEMHRSVTFAADCIQFDPS